MTEYNDIRLTGTETIKLHVCMHGTSSVMTLYGTTVTTDWHFEMLKEDE